MTPVRAAAIVRGDVPGLLRRGMPVYPPDTDLPLNPDEHDSAVVCAMPDADWLSVEPGASAWIGYARFNTWRRPRPVKPHLLTIDYTDPAALYLSLHWLADRGHLCGWMLPTTHGGRIEAWDGLTAWEVSAILVSVSVGRVARGVGPVTDLVTEVCWGIAGCPPGITRYHLVSVRDQGRRYMADVGRARRGPAVNERPAMYDKALADGCCLRVPGGLVVPV